MYLAILYPFFSDKCEDIAPGAFHNVCCIWEQAQLKHSYKRVFVILSKSIREIGLTELKMEHQRAVRGRSCHLPVYNMQELVCYTLREDEELHQTFQMLTLKVGLETPSGLDFSFLFLLPRRDIGWMTPFRDSGTKEVKRNFKLVVKDL